MKRYSVYALKVVKVGTGDNTRYLICKYNELTDTYIEVLTNEKLKVSDKTCVEPLSNYYSILSQCNYTTGQPLMLDKKALLQKYIDINSELTLVHNEEKLESKSDTLIPVDANSTLEKANEFIMDYIEGLKVSEAKRKEMFSNTNYLKWLENFTIEHPSFSDDDWLYFPEKISEEDNEKVKNLHLFFEGIDLYAKKNYIYPTECDFGGYYNIKLDNIGYEIGMLVGQGTLFFCNRTPLNKDLEYIDFNDIISDKKRDNTDVIAQQLQDLSNRVLELNKKGVPLNAIIETLDTTLTGIKEETKNPTKTLKRN